MDEKTSNKRVILRKVKTEDAVVLLDFIQEEKIKNFTDLPKTLPELELYIDHFYMNDQNKKNIRRVIVLSKNNEIIGSIVLKHISVKNQKADIGYWLGSKYEGKGLMTEALIILLTDIFDGMNIQRIQAWIRPDNIASIKLAEKLGFAYEGTARNFAQKHGLFHDFYLYGLLRQDFIRQMAQLKNQ